MPKLHPKYTPKYIKIQQQKGYATTGSINYPQLRLHKAVSEEGLEDLSIDSAK
jgi:hypothetical protein